MHHLSGRQAAMAFAACGLAWLWGACGRDPLHTFSSQDDDGQGEPGMNETSPSTGELHFQPAFIDFGSVARGASDHREITLVNSSSDVIELKLMVDGAPEFQILKRDCDSRLPPEGVCVIVLRFAPGRDGVFDAKLIARHSRGSVEAHVSGRSAEKQAPVGDLVGHWRFDEVENSSVKDLSLFGNDGLVVQGANPQASAAKPGLVEGRKPGSRAIDLQRNNSWIRVEPSASVNSTAESLAFTVTAWVKSTAPADSEFEWVIARHELGTLHKHFALGFHNRMLVAQVHFFFVSGPNPLLNDGRWHHIAATYDGVTLTVFSDGVVRASADLGWPIFADETPVTLGAGQALGTMREFFSGVVDDVRLFNKALSVGEVANLVKE